MTNSFTGPLEENDEEEKENVVILTNGKIKHAPPEIKWKPIEALASSQQFLSNYPKKLLSMWEHEV